MRVLLLAALCFSLAAQDAELDFAIEKFAGGYRFASGISWAPEGYLVYTDVPANIILRGMPGEQVEVFRRDTGGASGTAFDSQGRLIACETRARRVVRWDRKGALEVLAERWEGKRLNAPNDVAVRKDGNIYFTDPAFGYQADARELDFYGVYQITSRKELRLVAKPAGRPNGIALSPDGRILYVGNSDERNVRAYDLDGRGTASNERIFVAGTGAIPDGLRTDHEGNLYVAAGKLQVYSPDGRRLKEITIAEPPSGCVFGDGDQKSIYITARTSVYRLRAK